MWLKPKFSRLLELRAQDPGPFNSGATYEETTAPHPRGTPPTPGSAESDSPVETLLFGRLIFSLYLLFIRKEDGKGFTTFTLHSLRRSRNHGEERVAISEP